MLSKPGGLMDEALARMRAAVDRRMKELHETIGHEFVGMVRSWETAASYIDDPDPRFREAALYLMWICWRSRPETEVHFARVGLSDPSPHIRTLALQWLAFDYAGKCDPNVSKVMARAAMDKASPVSLRGHAYEMFCLVRGIDVSEAVSNASDAATDDLPAEVDLTLVKVFTAGVAV
jgi:hypothetical protein